MPWAVFHLLLDGPNGKGPPPLELLDGHQIIAAVVVWVIGVVSDVVWIQGRCRRLCRPHLGWGEVKEGLGIHQFPSPGELFDQQLLHDINQSQKTTPEGVFEAFTVIVSPVGLNPDFQWGVPQILGKGQPL